MQAFDKCDMQLRLKLVYYKYTIGEKKGKKAMSIQTHLLKKIVQISMLCLAFLLPLCADTPNNPVLVPNNVEQLAQETRAKKLLNMHEKAFRNLDELSDILQYLAQAINKKAIKHQEPEKARWWIQESQKVIRDIRKLAQEQVNLDEIHAHKIAQLTQLFSFHLNKTVDEKLKNLTIFPLDTMVIRSPLDVSLESIELKITRNEREITQLREKANLLGLSTLNRMVRSLDDINDAYHITSKVKIGAILMGLSLFALYVMPRELLKPAVRSDGTLDAFSDAMRPAEQPQASGFFDKTGNWLLQSWIGRTARHIQDNWLGPRPDYTKGTTQPTNSQNLKWAGRIEQIFNSAKEMIALVGFAGYKALGSEVSDSITDIRQSMRNEWAKLKGFSVTEKRSGYTTEQEITLDDQRLVGMQEQKRILKNIAHYVSNPEVYDNTNSAPPKSILLVGSSGSGKTFLAKALHGTINEAMEKVRQENRPGLKNKFGFKTVQWRELTRENGIKRIIENARNNAPCVIFIDELHNFPLQANGYSQTLHEFLTELNGINDVTDTKKQVILIAATNKPELIDSALRRTGRFGDMPIHCDKPNLAERKEYITVTLSLNGIDSTDIDSDTLAAELEGCTFSDIDTVLKDARFNARIMAQGLTQAHIESKIDLHIHKMKKDLPLTAQEKALVAAHQAGQALLYLLPETAPQAQLQKVTIHGVRPEIVDMHFYESTEQRKIHAAKPITYGAVFTYNPAETLKVYAANDVVKLAKIKLAGGLAEKLLLDFEGSEYSQKSHADAFTLIKQILLKGIQEDMLSEVKQNELADQALELIATYQDEIGEVLRAHKPELQAIAKALETNGTLRMKQLTQLLHDLPMQTQVT